ncbi:MAG: hypothetical protein ACK5HS_03680 [Mycoplasmatales bacterium]
MIKNKIVFVIVGILLILLQNIFVYTIAFPLNINIGITFILCYIFYDQLQFQLKERKQDSKLIEIAILGLSYELIIGKSFGFYIIMFLLIPYFIEYIYINYYSHLLGFAFIGLYMIIFRITPSIILSFINNGYTYKFQYFIRGHQGIFVLVNSIILYLFLRYRVKIK